MNLIVKLWNHAELCKHWDEGTFIHETLKKYSDDNINLIPMKNDRDFGYLAEYENEIIISFRGTENLKSAVSNLNVLSHDDLNDVYDNFYHKGFYSSWENFKSFIVSYLKTNSKDKKIYFTGHSRGGSLALIAFIDLCLTEFKKDRQSLTCVNFGAMPVIKNDNNIYNGLYSFCEKNVLRISNKKDIVPKLFNALEFEHIGKEQILDEEYSFFKLKNSHTYSSYTKSLIKFYDNSQEDVKILKEILKRCKT